MWGTGGAAGEAKVAGGGGVDPPPPPALGGWVGGRVGCSDHTVTQVTRGDNLTKRFEVTTPFQVPNQTR